MPTGEHETPIELVKIEPALMVSLAGHYNLPAPTYEARANPAAAVFATRCHSRDPQIDRAFPALGAALQTAGLSRATACHDIVLAGLPMPARERWESFMTVTAQQYHSELFRTLAAEHEAQGEARSILLVLEANGVPVPESARATILACTDVDQLNTWLRRAIKATSVEDVLDA